VRLRIALIVVSALACAPPASVAELRAQASPFAPFEGDGGVEITLVLVQNGQPPLTLRRAGAGARNVVLLDSASATPQQLTDAVVSLLAAEAADPNGRDRSDRIASRANLDPHPPVYPWAAEALQRLREAAVRPVAGMGDHRALEIWLPPTRLVPG